MALLRVSNLTKSFGGVVAIDDVTFSVYPGQIKAIIGPNGAGKTTVFNLLSGIIRPQSGKMIFSNRNITNLRPHRIASLGLGRTFQNTLLFERMSVIENVMVARETKVKNSFFTYLLRLPKSFSTEKDIKEKAFKALKLVGMEKRQNETAGNLPPGDRHLLEIARALATEPQIILLDEPAAGLNRKETEHLSSIIYKMRDQGVTVLLVEHDMGLVMEISDEIVVLDHGRKIAEGPPLLIREDEKVIEAYLGSEVDADG